MGIVPKQELPNYNVFYEQRNFSSGKPEVIDQWHHIPFGDMIFDFDFGKKTFKISASFWTKLLFARPKNGN